MGLVDEPDPQGAQIRAQSAPGCKFLTFSFTQSFFMYTRRGAAYRPHGFLQYNMDAKYKFFMAFFPRICLDFGNLMSLHEPVCQKL